MTQATWYDAQKVGFKGSKILTEWLAARKGNQAARAAKPTGGSRMYAGAQFNRLTGDWQALNTSADSEILTSLRLLRARSRELVRDNEHAKNAVRIVQNNVVGTGIGIQAQVVNGRGKLQDKINSQIEKAWSDWCEADTCHTAGKLALPDMLRLIVGQVVEAGDMGLRKVRKPFGKGKIPFALEVIESDRLMDQFQSARAPNGNAIRLGVEVDEWGRPSGYWLHPAHPGDYQFQYFVAAKFLRVEASDFIHPYIIDRWPQTRGVPWMHAVLRRMRDMAGYGEAEIVKARASAAVVGFITSPDPVAPDDTVDGQQVMDFAPGTVQRLLPGETFAGFNPSSPNAAMEPFMRYMLRCMAAGVGVSYESLSRDYSQSNYSSSRLALLDDRDLWRVLQGWLIRAVLWDIYREWLDAAVLSGVVNIPDYFTNKAKYQAVRFKPRGWTWIDPTREVTAFRTAVRAGFMSVDDVIAQTGGGADSEDTFKARRRELDKMAELNLVFDTDPAQTDDKGKAQATEPAQEADGAPAAPAEPDGDEGATGSDSADSAN